MGIDSSCRLSAIAKQFQLVQWFFFIHPWVVHMLCCALLIDYSSSLHMNGLERATQSQLMWRIQVILVPLVIKKKNRLMAYQDTWCITIQSCVMIVQPHPNVHGLWSQQVALRLLDEPILHKQLTTTEDDSPGSRSSWQRYWEVLSVTTTTRCRRMSSRLGIWNV